MQLSRKRIIAAAIELIEADGVEAASMQRLATELGCGLMPLYNHVSSHNALLDGVADEVMSGIAWTSMPDASPQDRVRALACAVRQVAMAHPRCAMLALTRRGVPASLARPAETALSALREAGFSGPGAVLIVRAFASYLVGVLAREAGFAPGLTEADDSARQLRPVEFPQLTEWQSELRASDIDGDFEFGAELLARAITARASCATAS
ncbi:MAG TPA: TetR/AcrR family transcriptional regulator C-terminal domain-containing protein [Streptosporangiaceae bacterium]|nr:TetR/AcrR family transcriptional regulator C-terminal domain-containing protein [Streptosporangiaceae bacterium]